MIEYEYVRPRLDARLKDEVIEFWRDEDALPQEVATGRVNGLLGVARNNDEIVAVSTGTISFNYLEGQPLIDYLTYVGARFRMQGIARHLLSVCCEALDTFVSAQSDPEAVGVVIRIPAGLADKLDQHLWWRDVDFSFVGKASGGDHLRIRYFDEVKLK